MASWPARIFVSVVFLVFGIAFVAETASLVREFGPFGIALPIMLVDAQNFLFFPLAGLVVLLAFWQPAVVATDAYWRSRVPGGPIIFAIGAVVVLTGSLALSLQFAASTSHSPFEIAPRVLMADQGSAERAPILQAVAEARLQSRRENGLVGQASSCQADLLRYTPTANEVSYCIAAGREMTHVDCCRARALMKAASVEMFQEEASATATVHRFTQPLKVTFFFVLLAIGMMLARRRARLMQFYPREVEDFAMPVIIGAGLMLIWPLMNAAFNQTSTVLYGDADGSLYRVLEQIYAMGFVFWALALFIFAIKAFPNTFETIGEIVATILALFGIAQYQTLIVYANRTVGIGADWGSLAVFALVVAASAWFILGERDG
jgi:hypothetical protein